MMAAGDTLAEIGEARWSAEPTGRKGRASTLLCLVVLAVSRERGDGPPAPEADDGRGAHVPTRGDDEVTTTAGGRAGVGGAIESSTHRTPDHRIFQTLMFQIQRGESFPLLVLLS